MEPQELVQQLELLAARIEDDYHFRKIHEDLVYAVYKTRKMFKLLDSTEQVRADRMDKLAELCFSVGQSIKIDHVT